MPGIVRVPAAKLQAEIGHSRDSMDDAVAPAAQPGIPLPEVLASKASFKL
jgi:hypothetical protein